MESILHLASKLSFERKKLSIAFYHFTANFPHLKVENINAIKVLAKIMSNEI